MNSKLRIRASRWLMTVIIALVVLGSVAAVPWPTAWKQWLYSRPIQLAPADAPRLAGVTLTDEVYRRTRLGLVDLRLIDDRGTETPYVLFTREGSKNTLSRATTLHEKSFAPGLYTQVVLEIIGQAPFHNAVEIQTPETDFIEWVRVEASDDARTWRIVQQRAPIFRFEKEYHQGIQLVNYSENNARFLRVHILDGDKQFPVSGANVMYQTMEPPERIPLSAELKPDAKSAPGRSAWTVDLGGASVPVSEIKFDVASPGEFIRSVELSASFDNQNWDTFARSEIYRYRQGDTVQEQLGIPVPPGGARGRYGRVEIVNHNDAPLGGAVPHLYATPSHVIFEQQPGRSYRLLYGQSQVNEPQYDISRRVTAKQMDAAIGGQIGPEETNSDWSDPRPWTEQHDVLLWIALGIAVLLLGYSAVRSLRRSASDTTASS
ncbi:MAG: DUF3999 family protein [Candidatus Acidiferrales bacterium]